MQKMIAINTIKVQKGRADEILARFAKPKSVHTFEGFILMEVLQTENCEDYDELKICTTWEDESFFEQWVNSRESKEAHGNKQKEEEKEQNSPVISFKLSKHRIVFQHLPAVVSK